MYTVTGICYLTTVMPRTKGQDQDQRAQDCIFSVWKPTWRLVSRSHHWIWDVFNTIIVTSTVDVYV